MYIVQLISVSSFLARNEYLLFKIDVAYDFLSILLSARTVLGNHLHVHIVTLESNYLEMSWAILPTAMADLCHFW